MALLLFLDHHSGTTLSFLWLTRARHQCIKQEEEALGGQKWDKRGRPEGSTLQTQGSATQWYRKTQQGTIDLYLLREASSGRDAKEIESEHLRLTFHSLYYVMLSIKISYMYITYLKTLQSFPCKTHHGYLRFFSWGESKMTFLFIINICTHTITFSSIAHTRILNMSKSQFKH